MTLTSKDRRVQFACGPWEHYTDGHPPEKNCEKDRRAYRLGLTLQQKKELSLFEQSIAWFENGVHHPLPDCDEPEHNVSSSAPQAIEMNIEADWPEGIPADFSIRNQELSARHDSATSIGGYSPGKAKASKEYSPYFHNHDHDHDCEKSLLSPDAISIFMPSSVYCTRKSYAGMRQMGVEMCAPQRLCRVVRNVVSGALLVMAVVTTMTVFGG